MAAYLGAPLLWKHWVAGVPGLEVQGGSEDLNLRAGEARWALRANFLAEECWHPKQPALGSGSAGFFLAPSHPPSLPAETSLLESGE